MRRALLSLLIGVALLSGIPAQAFWQSRGSSYNLAIGGVVAPLAFTALANGTVGGSPIAGSGTYTGTAPTSISSATWTGCGGGSSTPAGFSAATGTWSATFTVPGSSGSGCTIAITDNRTDTATSPGVTISATVTAFDPSNTGALSTLSGGNLIVTANGAGGGSAYGNSRSIASHSTGKYYCEISFTNNGGSDANIQVGVGTTSTSLTTYMGFDANQSIGDFAVFTNLYLSGGATGTVSTWTVSNVVSTAVDIGAGLYWQRVNGGNWNASGTANPATGTGGISFSAITPPVYFFVSLAQGTGGTSATANFGASAYSYTPPSGFGNW